MKSNTRIIAIGSGLAAVAVAWAVLYGMNGSDVHATPPAVLDDFVLTEGAPPAPEVRFLDAEGSEVRLADFSGRHVVLNLWATWCGPCIAELPSLARLKEALDPAHFVVLAVDLEDLPVADVAAFLAENNASALEVHRNPSLDLMAALEVYGLPYTLVVDPRGNQVGSAFGEEPWDAPQAVAYFRSLALTAE